MFYGKHFSSMYSGSMVGSGAIVFAVMGYVIAMQRPDKTVGSQVELNPKLLCAILGEEQGDVEKAIKTLCSPDEESTTKKEQGRRLIRLGQFTYQVVNGAKYLKIRNEEERREQNREAKRRERMKSKPANGEMPYAKGVGDGTVDESTGEPKQPDKIPPPGDNPNSDECQNS